MTTRGAALLAAIAVVSGAAAHAEIFASVYGGSSWAQDSDVQLLAPGLDLRFRGVAWQGRSFESPPYYGIRGGWWIGSLPELGLSIDFTHVKAIADLDGVVGVSGLAGVPAQPVYGALRLGRAFDHLELSHGLNTLTLNAQLRWLPHGERDASPLGRLQPYLGLGAGVAIPHVEVRQGLLSASGYQVAGPAAQGFLGLSVDVVHYLSLFAEYRIAWADIDARLGSAGSLRTRLWTQHVSVGLTLSYPWRTAEGSP